MSKKRKKAEPEERYLFDLTESECRIVADALALYAAVEGETPAVRRLGISFESAAGEPWSQS